MDGHPADPRPYRYFVAYSWGGGNGSIEACLARPVSGWEDIEAFTEMAVQSMRGKVDPIALRARQVVILNYQLLSGPTDTETERYRTEARQAAEDSGRRMRLIVQLHDALCEAPRTPKVESVLDAVDAEARRSPWIRERITDEGANRG